MENNTRHQIQGLIQEIKVYREHSLFEEALGKCIQLAKLIKQSDGIENRQKLLHMVSKKVKVLKNDAHSFVEAGASVQMSTEEEDVIKKLFHLTEGERDVPSALVGAEALIVFGQFEKALIEFNRLLKDDSLRVEAAKNILRCHIGLAAIDDAVSQYREWFSGDNFSPEQLGNVHHFLQDILDRKEMDIRLPEPEISTPPVEKKAEEDEIVDILSILIPQYDKTQKGDDISLDVNFQRGNMISVIIPDENKRFVDRLKIGLELVDVLFFSSNIIFKDTCVVSEKREIESGPKKGEFTLVLKLN